MKYSVMSVRFLFLSLICSASITGCTSLSLSSLDWRTNNKYATSKNPAYEIVALWEPSEGKGVDGLPTRGFAGQILFFQHNNPSPIYVKGDVMIHLFDDQGDAEQQSKPLHQYKFEKGAWQVHAVESTLGPGYQVFIPYVRKGRDQAECALRVQLTQPESPDVYSSMVSVKLEGKAPQTKQHTLTDNQVVLKAKAKLQVDTLARRKTGEQLELSSQQLNERMQVSSIQKNEIQQSHFETQSPINDERDERIRQLEYQVTRLLNEQKQQANVSSTGTDTESTSHRSTHYRQFQLSGVQE